MTAGVVDERERQELAEAVAESLAARGAADGMRLLDLMRAEQGLVEALRVIRTEIALLVRMAPAPGDV